jgi:hypothetical protein
VTLHARETLLMQPTKISFRFLRQDSDKTVRIFRVYKVDFTLFNDAYPTASGRLYIKSNDRVFIVN